jgi:hypothetical protein
MKQRLYLLTVQREMLKNAMRNQTQIVGWNGEKAV